MSPLDPVSRESASEIRVRLDVGRQDAIVQGGCKVRTRLQVDRVQAPAYQYGGVTAAHNACSAVAVYDRLIRHGSWGNIDSGTCHVWGPRLDDTICSNVAESHATETRLGRIGEGPQLDMIQRWESP
jgi:hypothetical protein